jgi:uncharacterized protein YbbC (DUF1343 family)
MSKNVLTGADQIHTIGSKLLKGKRYGLLTNATGVDSKLRSTIDICNEMEEGKLTAFFACEHGLRNEKQAGILFEDEIDPVYAIPVYSLYGKNCKPTDGMLKDLDVVIYDIQDLGVRFYTYLSTLVYMMEACARNKVSLVVLDRPNPLGGYRIEGGLLKDGFYSMVGAWRMPAMTGMTIGEMSQLVNGQMENPCELQVVKLVGWERWMEYPDTGLPWAMPSPNIPTMDTTRVYTGNCVFEGTNVSEGRGTTKPFEIVGAPWLDTLKVCKILNDMNLPGVWFHNVTFTPTFRKFTDELCHGIMTYVTDKSEFCTTETGLHLLHQIMVAHPDKFEWKIKNELGHEEGFYPIDVLMGSDEVRKTLHKPGAVDKIIESWRNDSKEWKNIRKPYLLYEEDENHPHA